MVTSLTQLQDLGKDLHAQYVSHTIDADMEAFFRYENQREPPSLSNQESLRSGNKSDILEWLKASTGRSAEAKAATVVVLDMAAVVQGLCVTASGAICGVTSHSNCHIG